MGLILPSGPAFARWSDNIGLPLTADGLDYGTGITPAGSEHVDSSVFTLLPALAHDCEYLVLAISGYASSGRDGSALMDIMVDPAGGTSWSELISDLIVGFAGFVEMDGGGSLGVPLMYHFPLWIPAGASIGARARASFLSGGVYQAPTNTPRVVAFVAGGNKNPASWWSGQKVETVGTMAPSSSRGQDHAASGSVSVTGAADNGSGLIRLTVSSTTGWSTGDVRRVVNVGGTTEANGVWTTTVIDGTHIDLQGSTFVNAYTSLGSVSGVFSSWTSLGSPTSARAGALQYGVGGPATGSVSGKVYRYEFGAGSVQIGPCIYRGMGSLETGTHYLPGPVFCDIPAAMQMQVRAACGTTSPQTLDCAAYLVQ